MAIPTTFSTPFSLKVLIDLIDPRPKSQNEVLFFSGSHLNCHLGVAEVRDAALATSGPKYSKNGIASSVDPDDLKKGNSSPPINKSQI